MTEAQKILHREGFKKVACGTMIRLAEEAGLSNEADHNTYRDEKGTMLAFQVGTTFGGFECYVHADII